jgi:serine/threonine-protein kinase
MNPGGGTLAGGLTRQGGVTLARRYRLEQVIGRGGMSTVYRGTDLVLGRTVAVKVLLAALADQDPTYVARFEREARAAAGLASSAVVTVYDTGVDDGSQYIVMEYIAGHSLDEILQVGRPLKLSEAVRIAERVADALRAAHAAGILHRDIKPANVMVAEDGAVKVLDFGIARTLDGTSLTQAASLIGTAAYMAPERALGQAGDTRSDIYSLGCLLYAMLTGHPPFSGEVSAAVLHQHINTAARPPGELRSGVPPALDALVLAMLAKSADERPATATDVGDRLRVLSGAALGAPSGATAAPATAAITAATAPIAARAATARLGGFPGARRAPLADHRRRALVMALVTAAVALAAIALLAAGGSPSRSAQRAATTRHQARTPGTQAPPASTPAPATPASKPPKTPPGHDGEPGQHGAGGPGARVTPPGKAKKKGGDGGD